MVARILITTVLTIFMFSAAFSQNTAIRGKVIDFETGEALIGATVMIQGTSIGTSADIDGNYTLPINTSGKYNIICSYISYISDTIKITIEKGNIEIKNFSLKTSSVTMQAFTVEEKAVRNSENYMNTIKRKSPVLMEGISSQEISKRGDSDAASAAKRVTGVTIEGGKYVYVRGLSDRYSKTLLNGSEIPGLDPNRNTVQMDLFPSNLLENMVIYKTFSPDLPGDFTGGLVNIETKDFPEKFTFMFSSSVGYNTLSSLNNNFLTSSKGSTDFLGWDDGSRSIPTEAKTKIPALFSDNQKLSDITKSFSKEMTPIQGKSSLNTNSSFSVGNQYKVFGKQLGFIAGLTYRTEFSHLEKDARTARYSLVGEGSTGLNENRNLKDIKSYESVLWGGLINLSYKLSANHKIGVRYIHNQSGTSSASYQEGSLPFDAIGLVYQSQSIGYQERALTSYQASGEHYFKKLSKLKADWLFTYAKSEQNEPDLRFFNSDYEIMENAEGGMDTLRRVQAALYTVPTRFYSYLGEKNIDTKINFEFELNPKSKKVSKLKFGASNLLKDRTVTQFRFNYQLQGTNYNGNPQDFFSDENMNLPGSGNPVNNYMYIADASELRNRYIGEQQVSATYLMGDIWIKEKLRIITGARVEYANIYLASADTSLPVGELINTDVLPALNLTYALNTKNNLRFAYTRTLARPSFREIAPYADYDFATSWVRIGNPNLERTLVDNIDFRWEKYPSFSEIISFGVFFKRFNSPIDVVFNPKAANATPEITWINVGQIDQTQSPYAYLYGAEMEFKKSLSFISEALKNYRIGGNVSYMQSKVEIDSLSLSVIRSVNPDANPYRPMFGQSPYIVNGFFEYSNDTLGLSLNISYNVSGPKLAVVMLGGIPDVYQQPVHSLDFRINKEIAKKLSVNFSIRNMLDPIVKMTHTYNDKEYIFNSYRRGRTFSLGLRYLIN